MTQWVRIGAVSEMPREGSAKAFQAAGIPICVARIRGQLAALQNECPHHGALLSDGVIEHGRVVCSWHGWSFDPKTGAELRNPLGSATVFPLRVEGDDVLCGVES
jgi:nitrite reductase/ring-hydroxylating ferredoxin subunit